MSLSEITINEGTQTPIQTDLVGTVNYNITKLDYGDLGTTNLFTGTIPEISNLVGGTIGVVSSLANGSVKVTAGTAIVTSGSISVTSGTIGAFTADIPGGTIDLLSVLANGTIGAGTIAVSAGTVIMTNGTVGAGTVAVSAGTVIMTAGTVAAGTVAVSAGTITHGTIDAGTVKLDGRIARNVLSYGLTFSGTAAAYGTLVGSTVVGAGTSIWVNELSIINSGGGTVTGLIGLGTALSGSSVLAKGGFGAQGGIQKTFSMPVNAGMTNQDLVCYIGAAGTVDFNVSYFISA